MIRFRIGQTWKREPGASPVDSFGLELDGVDLLMGASEEPLARVVPELVQALHGVALEGRTSAQLSLPEAHLEVALFRRGSQVSLKVVSLARPARLTRPAVELELSELVQATIKCARGLIRDLSEVTPSADPDARHRKMLRQLGQLERRPSAEARFERFDSGYGYRLFAQTPGSFGFELHDVDDLILTFGSRSPAALPSLLFDGALTLALGEPGSSPWRAEGSLFLIALELSRQAGELVQALEAGDRQFSMAPGGVGSELRLRLDERTANHGAERFALDPRRLARSMYELPLALVFALTNRNQSQAKNPYVRELGARCREGLSHLRSDVDAAPEEPTVPTKRPRRSAGGSPIKTSGRLRRLRLEPVWEKSSLGGDSAGRIILTPKGPIFASLEMACAFSSQGELLFRRVATHGLATSSDGWVIAAFQNRALAYRSGEANARWLRDHDGAPLGPELLHQDGLLFAPVASRGAAAYSELTGRELWRVDPSRTQRGYFALHGHRALLATDAGYLYGLDAATGQVRYRMRAALPFVCAPVPWEKKLLGLLCRANRSAVVAAELHSGQILWTQEIPLSAPTPPLPIPGRVLVTGLQDGMALLVCLSSKGAPLWERRLHLGHPPYQQLRVGRSVLVKDAAGGAVLVSAEGHIDWRVGAAGEDLPVAIPPVLARGIVLLPGETVRAVDPKGGGVLAEVKAGLGLTDLVADARLNLYTLTEGGTLRAFRLRSHFAVL